MSSQPTSSADSNEPQHFRREKSKSLFTRDMLVPSMGQAVKMLNPETMARNPVMFVAELGAGADDARHAFRGRFRHAKVWVTFWRSRSGCG